MQHHTLKLTPADVPVHRPTGIVRHTYNLPYPLARRLVFIITNNLGADERVARHTVFGWVQSTDEVDLPGEPHSACVIRFNFSASCFRAATRATQTVLQIAQPPPHVWWNDHTKAGTARIIVRHEAAGTAIECYPFSGEVGELRYYEEAVHQHRHIAHESASVHQLQHWLRARDEVAALHFAIVDRELRQAEQALTTLPPAPGSQLLQVQYDELATLLARAPSVQQTRHTTWPAGEERMRYAQGGCIRLYLAASKRGDRSEIETRHEVDANCAAPGMDDVADLELRQWFDAVRADIAEKYPEAFGPAPLCESPELVASYPGETAEQTKIRDLIEALLTDKPKLLDREVAEILTSKHGMYCTEDIAKKHRLARGIKKKRSKQ